MLTDEYSGEALYKAYQASGLEVAREFWRQNLQDVMTYDALHGKLWRYGMRIKERPELFQHVIGDSIKLSGDWMVLGDVQLPTTDYDFAALPAAIARRYLKHPRKLLIVGDLVNMDCFSDYENEIGLPGFRQEVEAARVLLLEWYRVFDRIVYLPGNHERRFSKKSHGALLMQDLAMLIDSRMETSNLDHAIISTDQGEWFAGHGSDYSINQLTVADALASKYRRHVISFHEHHAALGWEKFGHNVIVNGGGLFNMWYMAYVRLNTSKKPTMKNGFVMLKNGFPYLFGKEPLTNWDDWLNVKAIQLRKAG